MAHLEFGYQDPTSSEPLRLVIRGIRRLQGDSTSHRILPFTINVPRTLKQQIRTSNFSPVEQRLLWAAFTTAFYGFLCLSKFTNSTSDSATLQWSDVPLSSSTLTIRLRQSKTDPFRKGHTLQISATNTSTCPIQALLRYREMIPPAIRSGSLFSAGRFSPLSCTHVTNTLHRLLQQTCHNSHLYSSHSFRIGAATTSATAGFQPWLIKALGRWNSNAYMSYIRCPPHVLQTFTTTLARTNAS